MEKKKLYLQILYITIKKQRCKQPPFSRIHSQFPRIPAHEKYFSQCKMVYSKEKLQLKGLTTSNLLSKKCNFEENQNQLYLKINKFFRKNTGFQKQVCLGNCLKYVNLQHIIIMQLITFQQYFFNVQRLDIILKIFALK